MERSDSALIQETLAGSLQAFDELMVRHQRLVFKIALSYCKEREQALDVTQNVFFKVYRRLSQLHADERFKPWLVRIAYRESINWIRGRRWREGDDLAEVTATLPDSRLTQEMDLLARESSASLLRRLDCLNPRHRLAVTLKYYEGLSLREIGGILECSEGSVKNILFRSLEKLRGQWVQT